MALEMRIECERCHAPLTHVGVHLLMVTTQYQMTAMLPFQVKTDLP